MLLEKPGLNVVGANLFGDCGVDASGSIALAHQAILPRRAHLDACPIHLVTQLLTAEPGESRERGERGTVRVSAAQQVREVIRARC